MSPAVVTGLLFMMVLMFKTDAADGQCGLSPCGSGWYQLDKRRCVMMSPTRATFDEAEVFCQNEGGHLVSIRNVVELYRLVCLIHRLKRDIFSWYWVGGRTLQDAFQWIDGSGPASSFFPYIYKQGLGCMEMMSGVYWWATACSKKRHFVCQKPV